LVAHTLTKHILPVIDFGIDFHTGGASRSNYPQIRIEPNNILAQSFCAAFAPPLFFESSLIQGSLREEAASLGKNHFSV
jgi:Succinylglutamate desuccinylase / Aspartoacylase family.